MCMSANCPNNKSGIGNDSLCDCKPDGTTHFTTGNKEFAGGYLKWNTITEEWFAWELVGNEWLPVLYPEWTKNEKI